MADSNKTSRWLGGAPSASKNPFRRERSQSSTRNDEKFSLKKISIIIRSWKVKKLISRNFFSKTPKE